MSLQRNDRARIIAELRAELAQIEEAIISLERLAKQGSRRGRPPAWMPSRPPAGPAAQALPREWRTLKVRAVGRKPA